MYSSSKNAAREWGHATRIVALGEPLLELHAAHDQEIEVGFGGDVANAVVCLARLLKGRPPELTLVTALGGSSYAAWLRARLTREGIIVREPPAVTGMEPGIYGVPLNPQGGAFSYWRHRSAARLFLERATLTDFERLLDAPDVLLVTGITLALCSPESFEALCQWAQKHQHQCSIVFDTNFRPALWPSVWAARERIGRFGSLASIIATGLEDETSLRQVTGISDIVAHLGEADVELLIRMGPDGCVLAVNNHSTRVAAELATVVDTAGAGDAHLAGYLAARVRGLDPVTAAQFANRVAAVIVSQRGSAALPAAAFPPLP